MKKKFLIVLLVFSMFALISSVSAADKNVDTDDIDNIQQIIDNSTKGDNIVFKEGNYKGISFKVNKSLNIKGNGKVNFYYSEKNGWESMIQIGNTSLVNITGINFIGYSDEYRGKTGIMITSENSSNIQIKNCKFINASDGIIIGNYNYWLEEGEYDGKNIIISNNIFENCQLSIKIERVNGLDINSNIFKNGHEWGESISLGYCNNSRISRNNFTNNSGICIFTQGSNLTIERNKIINSNATIMVITESNVNIIYNIITNNRIDEEYPVSFDIIYMRDSNATIANNNITNNKNNFKEGSTTKYSIYLENMGIVRIYDNLISNNSNGIFIKDERLYDDNTDHPTADIYINNNKILKNELNGIKLIGTTKAKIKYNTISNNGKNGIVIIYSTQCEVSHNNITNNKRSGILLSDIDDDGELIPTLARSNPSVYRGNSSYCIIHNNNILNNRIGITLEGDAYFNTIKNNAIYNNAFAGVLLNRSSCFNNITGNDFEGNKYGILIDMYGNDSDYEGVDPEYIPDFSVNNTTIDHNRFYKNDKSIFVLSNDGENHGNIALENWFGTNNPEKIDSIDNKNWFVVKYSADKKHLKVGEKVKITYRIMLNDETSGNSMLLPYFQLILKDYSGNHNNKLLSQFVNSLSEHDARVSTSFIKTFNKSGIFYSNANIDEENILLKFNVVGTNETDPVDPNETDKNETDPDEIDPDENDPNDGINTPNTYPSNDSNVKASMAKTGKSYKHFFSFIKHFTKFSL